MTRCKRLGRDTWVAMTKDERRALHRARMIERRRRPREVGFTPIQNSRRRRS